MLLLDRSTIPYAIVIGVAAAGLILRLSLVVGLLAARSDGTSAGDSLLAWLGLGIGLGVVTAMPVRFTLDSLVLGRVQARVEVLLDGHEARQHAGEPVDLDALAKELRSAGLWGFSPRCEADPGGTIRIRIPDRASFLPAY